MASVGNTVMQLQVPHSRFSLLYLSAGPNPSSLFLQKRPSRFQPLAFSPLQNGSSPRGLGTEFSSKFLKFSGFGSLVRRRHESSVEFPTVVSASAAADADGREIGAPKGLEFSVFASQFYLFYSRPFKSILLFV